MEADDVLDEDSVRLRRCRPDDLDHVLDLLHFGDGRRTWNVGRGHRGNGAGAVLTHLGPTSGVQAELVPEDQKKKGQRLIESETFSA